MLANSSIDQAVQTTIGRTGTRCVPFELPKPYVVAPSGERNRLPPVPAQRQVSDNREVGRCDAHSYSVL